MYFAGNFHIAIGTTLASGARHMHQFGLADMQTFNASHTIHQLAFGPQPHSPFAPLPHQLNGVTNVVLEGIHNLVCLFIICFACLIYGF